MTADSAMNRTEADRYLRIALVLSVITVVYNIAEGLVSTFFGYTDETIALFGFGVDSFVEVVSGIGIGHMVWRMRRTPVTGHDRFERQALYVTGSAFFVLAAGLVAGSILNLVYRVKPDTTIPGIIISAISIVTMWFLYSWKLKTGRKLDSAPIIADANCTKTCFYLSFILLASSLLYELLRVNYVDIAGGLGIAWFAFSEGKETLEKARSNSLTCSCCDCHNDEEKP
jgi:divalent metal cation (Fe/Co/Zn/Cd) transporter